MHYSIKKTVAQISKSPNARDREHFDTLHFQKPSKEFFIHCLVFDLNHPDRVGEDLRSKNLLAFSR